MSNIKNPQSNPLKSSAPVRPPGGDTTPKKVYVCSPFRPTAVSLTDRAEEQRSNIERALKACRILAMMGIQPLAPQHFLVIPKAHIASAAELGEEQAALVGHIFAVIAKLTKELGFADGFRVVTNCGEDAGQTVKHLHFHVLGGKTLGSFN